MDPTRLYITIDTEYAAGLFGRGRAECFARSISGETAEGPAGIGFQMDVFERHGLKAVFFVDPMPALVWGVAAIEDVVGPIVARGHDVQLHLHTEWLAPSGAANPLGSRIGQNLWDFTFEEQCRLLDYARATLVAAGAPAPVAFRAGNYGADDNTLRALAELGIAFDSSHCPGIAGSLCRIGLGPGDRLPVERLGVIEVPTGCIAARGGGLRHAQLTALSSAEILAALRHARDGGQAGFTLVSHSFELLSRDRTRINHIVRRRFEQLCAGLERLTGIATGTYVEHPPHVQVLDTAPLPHRAWRTGRRLAEQALANALYDAR